MAANQAASDRLIAVYLRELKVAAWNRGVPSSQTATLQRDVRSQIDSALAEAGARDEATVYGVLDRLGPPIAFVERLSAAPRSAKQRALDTLLTPLTRVKALMTQRGWSWAEIGGLALLVIGPFVLWWLGPLFGISLVHYATNRWSDQAKRRATRFIGAMFAVQVLIVIGLLVFVVIEGGPLARLFDQVLSHFWLRFGMRGGVPMILVGGGEMSPLQILMASPLYLAGVGSAIYLALSPRYRPDPSSEAA
jgi:hypothetical protein